MILWRLQTGVYRLVALRGVGGLGGSCLYTNSDAECISEFQIEISAGILNFIASKFLEACPRRTFSYTRS
jgi:hypothetical protein